MSIYWIVAYNYSLDLLAWSKTIKCILEHCSKDQQIILNLLLHLNLYRIVRTSAQINFPRHWELIPL